MRVPSFAFLVVLLLTFGCCRKTPNKYYTKSIKVEVKEFVSSFVSTYDCYTSCVPDNQEDYQSPYIFLLVTINREFIVDGDVPTYAALPIGRDGPKDAIRNFDVTDSKGKSVEEKLISSVLLESYNGSCDSVVCGHYLLDFDNLENSYNENIGYFSPGCVDKPFVLILEKSSFANYSEFFLVFNDKRYLFPMVLNSENVFTIE